jgi:hypothetical protein
MGASNYFSQPAFALSMQRSRIYKTGEMGESMIQSLVMYVALAAIPLAAYFSYDYGIAKGIERQQSAAQKLTEKSVDAAEKIQPEKLKREAKTRETIRIVNAAPDPTGCAIVRPPQPVRERVRDLQSEQR